MSPNLKTSRLQLRPCNLKDLPQVYALWTDQKIRQFLFDDRIISLEEAHGFITDSGSNFEQHSYGLWSVFADADKLTQLIGFAGALATEEAPSLIYGIDPDFWGRGYATEATEAVVNYLLAELACPKVIADVDEPNLASIRVLKKLGMIQTHRSVVNRHPLLYFERSQSEVVS